MENGSADRETDVSPGLGPEEAPSSRPGGRQGGPPDPALRDRADTGVAWSALHIWGTRGLQLGLILVLVRLLSPRDFGLFAMAQVVLSLAHPAAGQGIPEALVQSDRDDPTVWATGLRAVLVGSLAVAGVLLVAAPWMADLFGSPDLVAVLRWLAPGVVLYGLHSMAYARIRSELAFGSHARAGLAGGVAELAVGIPVAMAGFGVWALVAGFYANLLVETGALLRYTGRLPWRAFGAAEYRRLLRFGRYIVFGSFTTFLNRRSDDFFVGIVLGAEILGYYTVAYRLLEFMTTVFLRAVERVAFPVFAKLQSTPALVADGIRTSFRFTSLVAFPAFAGLVFVAPDAVTVVLGDSWAPATGPLRILAAAGIGLCAVNVLPSAIRAAGYPQWNVAIDAVRGGLLAIAFYAAAGLGLEAVAWVFTAGVYIVFPAYFGAARRLFPLPLGGYLREAVAPLVATGAMVGVLALVSPAIQGWSPAWRLSVNVAGGMTLYLAVAFLVAREPLVSLQARARGVIAGSTGRRPRA